MIVVHLPVRAADETAARDAKIDEIEEETQRLTEKHILQYVGKTSRGLKLSDGGATARLYKEVSKSSLSKIVHIDLKRDLFNFDNDEKGLKRAR